MNRQLVGFKTDSGKVFDVQVKKTNIRSYWLLLKGTNNVIKVKKKSKKLVWEG